jgi:hypothetical protein
MLAALALAGCGSSTPTHDEFVARADRFCTEKRWNVEGSCQSPSEAPAGTVYARAAKLIANLVREFVVLAA